MGRPWGPKCARMGLSPPSGPVLIHFLWEIRKTNFGLFFFLVPSPERYLIDFWSILVVPFIHLLRFLANGGHSGFCNTSHVNSSICNVQGLICLVILEHFYRTPSWSAFSLVFCVFRCHFWLTFGAERGSGIDFGGSEHLIEKLDWKEFGQFGKF